jgi:AraC family transcriptional regulator
VPADLASDPAQWQSAQLRHWTGTPADMDQPPLDHYLIVQHLGGAKHIDRRRDGRTVSAVVECGSLSVVPVGTAFKWRTEGPIDFAHLYFSPTLLESTALRFDRKREPSLEDKVGCRDALLESLYGALLTEIRQPGPAYVLYLDCLLESFQLRLLRRFSSAGVRAANPRETLPPYRLRRVIDYVDAHLGNPIMLGDLTAIAGGSLFHFNRAFKNTTGEPPYRYVLRRRAERAKHLLTHTDLPVDSVAATCGFTSAIHLSRTVSRLLGTTPTRLRRDTPT